MIVVIRSTQQLHACSFCFALIKMDISVTTAEEMCKQLKQLHVQPELKDFPNQICNNLKYEENQFIHLQEEMHYLPSKIIEVGRYSSKDMHNYFPKFTIALKYQKYPCRGFRVNFCKKCGECGEFL